jgi:endonuclease/exonuclease/phosphatase family metal-dependent hydrolase
MKSKLVSILTVLIIIILTFITCSPLNKSINKKQKEVKILSYNVRNCKGLDDITDYRRIADIIKRIAPDVVVLQELDSATQRSNGIIVINELTSLTGLFKVFGGSIDYQGGRYGNGILLKEKPVTSKVVPLPGREEKRSLLIVELKDYIICCTHLSLTEEDRTTSVKIINEALKDSSKPVFLAGDFNSSPESEVVKTVEKTWLMLTNPQIPTIPSNNPKRCIDYIFAANYPGHEFHAKQTMVEQEPVASDHLPVWVEVEFK